MREIGARKKDRISCPPENTTILFETRWGTQDSEFSLQTTNLGGCPCGKGGKPQKPPQFLPLPFCLSFPSGNLLFQAPNPAHPQKSQPGVQSLHGDRNPTRTRPNPLHRPSPGLGGAGQPRARSLQQSAKIPSPRQAMAIRERRILLHHRDVHASCLSKNHRHGRGCHPPDPGSTEIRRRRA